MVEKRTDYEDYWNELSALQKETKNLDEFLEQESKQFREEGEDEADWLKDVGLDNLTDTYRQGREISESELNASVSLLSRHQADAVKRRVRTLNQTVRNRYRQQRGRHRKPDIRDVFKDVETSSTGTRSRSATPDSLDSEEEIATTTDWSGSRELLPVTGSALRTVSKSPPDVSNRVLPSHELFARAGHHWSVQRVDVASDTEGIELLGYQRFGTIHGLHWGVRTRSGSVPTVTLSALDLQSSSVPNNVPLLRNDNPVSFESFFETGHSEQRTNTNDPSQVEIIHVSPETNDAQEMLHVSDAESSMLRPLLWLELSSVFDKHSITLKKRMPYKRKRKENGNVFGVSLSSLVMRDRRICIDNSTVPQVFQMILGQLETRCCREEGILRIAGQKQRVETICTQIETNFYTKPAEIRETLEKTTCHELTSTLKRLLRELPQPLLTTELIDLFYKTHELPGRETQCKALNLLVLLLPIEHSGTLKILISFLNNVIKNESFNKMSLHNVAMIIAPSLFPPRSMQLHSGMDDSDITGQVKVAAICCHLVETFLQCGLELWKIPSGLWLQLQTSRNLQKPPRAKELLHRSNTHYDSGSGRIIKDRFS